MKKSLRNQTTTLFLIFVFLILEVSLVLANDIQIIGHRGAAGLMPENTLSGFKKAMEIGVARMAVKEATDEDLKNIKTAWDVKYDSGKRRDYKTYTRLGRDLHLAIARAPKTRLSKP